MAARLTLVKGPVLQKLLLLVLLTISGLGNPPQLGDAIQCYKCSGQQKKADCTQTIDCPGGRCFFQIFKGGTGPPLIERDCNIEDGATGSDSTFECMQDELKQPSGYCINAHESNHATVFKKCKEKEGAKSKNGLDSGRDDFDPELTLCTCSTELCNSDDLPQKKKPGGGSGGGGTSGADSMVVNGRKKIVQVGLISSGMIILRATHRLFH